MPKKQALSKSPIVVGTVSTRSTRRESVVNIEIVPKAVKTTRRSANKSAKGSPNPERVSARKKKGRGQTNESEGLSSDDVSEKIRNENKAILDLLKDWSDEDSNSTPSSFVPVSSESSSDYRIVFDETLTKKKRDSLSADQQNLIEILEGSSPQTSPKVSKDTLLEDDYANSGSIEIIEECVVEDDAIIIESSEENSNSVKSVEDNAVNKADNSDVEIVQSKYKYSEIPLPLGSKIRTQNEKLPMKKRLLQVVLEKNATFEPDQKEGKEVDRINFLKSKSGNEIAVSHPAEQQTKIVQKTILDSEISRIEAKSTHEILQHIAIGESDKIASEDINSEEPMEVCEEPVINEEVVDSNFDTTLIDVSNVELIQSTDEEASKTLGTSYADSVKDLERILSDDAIDSDINQLQGSLEETMHISEKQELPSRSKIGKSRKKLDQLPQNSVVIENPSKWKEGNLEGLNIQIAENKSPDKKSSISSESKLEKSPTKLQRSFSEVSSRTGPSQKSFLDIFEKSEKDKLMPKDEIDTRKLKKTVSEAYISNIEESRHVSESDTSVERMEVDSRNITELNAEENRLHTFPRNEIRAQPTGETHSGRPSSLTADTLKPKPETRKIDSKSDITSSKLWSAEEILENIYHPKPQVKALSASKAEKGVPKVQTAEDILASIYNPKPQLIVPESSPSDSSNSEEKKDIGPTTPTAEGTFDFEEISSSSSSDTKKILEKDVTSASDTENIGEVSSSLGYLTLNKSNERKSRGRPKKLSRMDTSEVGEDSSNSGSKLELSGSGEVEDISSEMTFETETRQKASKSSKKAIREAKNKTPKDSKKKKGHDELYKRSESAEDLRRSSRIKTIGPVKKKSHGLVKSKSESMINDIDNDNDNTSVSESEKNSTPSASPKPVSRERKSRWSSIKEPLPVSPLAKVENNSNNNNSVSPITIKPAASSVNSVAIIKQRMKSFIHLRENQYKTDRQVSKEAREMICDCYLAEEDIQKNEFGCGEDCLNRLLMIECGDLCQVGTRCTNKRFQKGQMASVEVFHTDKKGLGIRAAANIPYGEFILEYVGEVLGKEEFDKRAEIYSEDKNIHHYFMSLRPDAIIDATSKGNISRFINHSCEPNAETQKWTVNGELRIGFFSTRTILAGEEITFDYQFERYGREAQKCYCEAPSCRGWLGDSPDASEDEEEEEAQKVHDKEAKKDDTIAQSIESAINAALAKEFGTDSPKIPSDESADVEKKSDDAATATVTEPVQPLAIRPKKKIRKDIFEDLDQLKEELEMLATTGLKNQQHTLKLSRLMVRAKDPEQRKKLLHILRRGELSCRRLFLDYHGLRLIHGYIVDAEQLAKEDKQFESSKLELLQTLAVLPIQNKTILIESKVLPAVEEMSGKNEDRSRKEPLSEKGEEIRFLAQKLLEGWTNLKESFKIPKKQRIEQMKEHEKEANKKFMESRSRTEDEDSSRKNDTRYRSSWSRYKSERESSSRKGSKYEDKDKPSAEFLRISKQERRKLFALQMELKEHERRLKQREMWRQHEMNCMMIGADPRFTAPFDPSKGFQYVWNPSIGQWQALPAPITQTQVVYATSQSLTAPATQPAAQNWAAYPGQSMISTIPMLSGTHTQLPGLNIPGLQALHAEVAQPQPPLPSTPPVYLDIKKQEDDPSQVKFAGPIPPPVKLPPKWKCAKDKYGRPYYYHIKIRKSQWEPPPFSEEVKVPESSESSSSDSSSLSTESSSDSDSDGEIDDEKLLFDVRKQIETNQKVTLIKKEEKLTPSPDVKVENSDDDETMDQSDITLTNTEGLGELSLLDLRLKEQFNLEADDSPPQKKKRTGLCTEIIISPRTEEDRLQFKEDVKRYKANKEKLKRQKLLQRSSKQKRKLDDVLEEDETEKLKDKRAKTSVKNKIKEIQNAAGDDAKRIKETFRTDLAGTVVNVLNVYRKPDCKTARIVNTEDFKHLARKLTHFVMLKELKRLDKIEELMCTESVKVKAREYIKKYMSKFGELYFKRHDEPDFRD